MVSINSLREAIFQCMTEHDGGPLALREIRAWVEEHYPGRWKDVGTALADLTINGNASSQYRAADRFLKRVGRGKYALARENDDAGAGELMARISVNPDIFGGKPIIRGRRLAVEHVLGMLANGATDAELLDHYPWLERDDIRACLHYAYRLAANERVEPAFDFGASNG